MPRLYVGVVMNNTALGDEMHRNQKDLLRGLAQATQLQTPIRGIIYQSSETTGELARRHQETRKRWTGLKASISYYDENQAPTRPVHRRLDPDSPDFLWEEDWKRIDGGEITLWLYLGTHGVIVNPGSLAYARTHPEYQELPEAPNGIGAFHLDPQHNLFSYELAIYLGRIYRRYPGIRIFLQTEACYGGLILKQVQEYLQLTPGFSGHLTWLSGVGMVPAQGIPWVYREDCSLGTVFGLWWALLSRHPEDSFAQLFQRWQQLLAKYDLYNPLVYSNFFMDLVNLDQVTTEEEIKTHLRPQFGQTQELRVSEGFLLSTQLPVPPYSEGRSFEELKPAQILKLKGFWLCPHCTSQNANHLTRCTVCGQARTSLQLPVTCERWHQMNLWTQILQELFRRKSEDLLLSERCFPFLTRRIQEGAPWGKINRDQRSELVDQIVGELMTCGEIKTSS